MHIVLVHIHVKPENVEEFKLATLDNARNSVLEPGVVRFDMLQQADAPARFVLIEIYKTPEDQLKHRDTRHYLTWRDAVTNWMAEPRVGIKYSNLFPDDAGWNI
jgi:(4S)-4-hydroxy-5-phosphonooxypentane-2,3-dione isomerase